MELLWHEDPRWISDGVRPVRAHAAVQRLRPHLASAWLLYTSTAVFLEVMLSVGVAGASVKGKDPLGEVPSMC